MDEMLIAIAQRGFQSGRLDAKDIVSVCAALLALKDIKPVIHNHTHVGGLRLKSEEPRKGIRA